ncbi:MAG: VWA domain-containing protein [Acidobacteria bacterium]|nr:VWA domain-containing protein [Acidobacteriota bacterium]MBI3427951.1 VWA domain-containing protein [Acidobacteriota bacterium]
MRTHNHKLTSALLIPLFFSLTSAQPLIQRQQQGPPKPESTPERSAAVKLRITVTDGLGRYVPDLHREDFVIESGKAVRPISYFSERDEPYSVVFLVDISGSMETSNSKVNRFSFLAGAVQRFIQVANPDNEYLIASFSREPRLLLDWTHDQSAIAVTLTDLAKEKPGGQTAVRDACFFGLGQARRGTKSGKAVILLSDGVDNAIDSNIKSITPQRLKQELQENEVQTYSINLGSLHLSRTDSPNFAMEVGGGREMLENFAKPTGGRAFHPVNVAGLQAAFEAVAVELRVQYVLGFNPSPQTGQGFTKVKVRLAPQVEAKYKVKGLLARHREGYFAGVGQK